MQFRHENPRIDNDILWKHGISRIDFTEHDLRRIIKPPVWEIVVASAMAMQEQDDLSFEPGNIVFHPQHNYLFEVDSVRDNRMRMPPNNYIRVDSHSRKLGRMPFRSTAIIHLGYLIDAHFPYNDRITVIESDAMSDVLAKVAMTLANEGLIE